MSTPRYVAVKSGDNYEFHRVDSEYRAQIGGAVAGGLLLSWVGLRRGSLAGLSVAAAGAGLIYFGCTGRNPIAELRKLGEKMSAPEGSPSHQHGGVISEQRPADSIDEAAMESFPASDPPARFAGSI